MQQIDYKLLFLWFVSRTHSKLRKVRKTLIRRHTTSHAGYDTSRRIRKRIGAFGWAKTIGSIARLKVQGSAGATAAFILRMTAYNLVMLPKIIEVTP